MTKGVKISLACVIVIFIVSVVLTVIFMRPKKADNDAVWVEIVRNDEVLYRLDLNSEEDRSFRIECDNGWNEVTISSGKISITDADCPDKTCIKTGVLRSEYVPIICLPHKLVIRYADDNSE